MQHLSNREYHARPEISKSQLDLINRDIYALEWQKKAPIDNNKLATLNFGSAMHALILEPWLFDTDFVVMPKFNLRTNSGKEEKEQFIIENEGKTVLTADEREKLEILWHSALAHPAAREAIEAEGVYEQSMFWLNEETAINCRCRPDKIITTPGRLIDIKTTPDLSKFKFSVEDYRYHVQAAFYKDGIEANGYETGDMEFLVIQTNVSCGRYPIAMYTLPWEIIEHGRTCYMNDLRKYADYLDSDKKPKSQELEMHRGFWHRIEEEQAGGIY